MDGVNYKISEQVSDNQSRKKLLANVVKEAVGEQVHFADLRLRVQEWVRENAVFPCRTFPVSSGICINVTDDDHQGSRQIVFRLPSDIAARFLKEYNDGW